MQHECLTYLCRAVQMRSKRPICVVELLTQSPAFVFLKRGRIGGATERLLLGGVTTKPAATGDRTYLMPRLCPSAPRPPPLPRCRCRDAKWNMRAGFFSFQSCPLRSRTPGPQRGWRELQERRGLGWSTEPLLLWMSASYTWLTFLSTLCPPFLLSLPPTTTTRPPPHSLVVLLSGSQLSDWEMAGETEVFCPGRWSREDWGLRTQMHKWSVFPSAPVKLGTCCNT